MSTIAPARPMTVPEALARVPSSLYRMTLKQYETMIAAGSFTKRDRVQLINGYLVTRMTELPPHGATCEMIRLAIEKFFPTDAWHFRNEKSLRIPGYASMPLPDLVLVRGTPRAATRTVTPSHPTPPWLWRWPLRAWMRTGRWPPFMAREAFRCTGSPT